MTEGGFGCRTKWLFASFTLDQVQTVRVYRTGLIRFWTGHQGLKGATTVEPLYKMPRHLVSVCPISMDGDQNRTLKRLYSASLTKLLRNIPD